MADRFDRFTERARHALLAAQEEALARNHNYVGTEHLLLGLVRQADSTASKTIAGLGIHLEQIRHAAR